MHFISGITSIEEGSVDGTNLALSSTSISRISFAKEPAVTKLKRSIKLLDEETIEQIIFMETSKTALSKHLEIRYTKIN